MMGVIARVKIFAGREVEFEEIFAERRRNVLATEPGTLMYDLFRSNHADSLYFAVERFVSEAAYTAHRAGSVGHERMLACMDGAPEIDYMGPVNDCV